MSVQLQLNDFNEICRMCLNRDGTLINIFFSDTAEVISEITSLRLQEGDSLPENICIPCMDKCTDYYKFRQLCQQSYRSLQSILSHNSNIDNKPFDIPKAEPAAIYSSLVKIKKELTNVPTIKSKLNKRIEIKRSLKDLIPLETYNASKRLEEINDASVVNQEVDTIAEQDASEEVVSEQDIFGNFDLADYVTETSLSTDVKQEDQKGHIRLEEHKKKDFCKYCRAEFNNLEKHVQDYHLPDDSHYCYLCSTIGSSSYSSLKQFQTHLKYHRQLAKHQCEECGKWFKFKNQKIVHKRSHTEERPAICEICNKSFKDPRYLTVHLKSHTGEKPHKCEICQKGFRHKFSLKVHMKCHSTEREHMCTICGKTFIYGHNLKIHIRQHTGERPYTCHLCFTSFISCSVLRAHMLTHSDYKRFECKVCAKKFKRTGDLNVHMRSHTGEKPYACSLCNNKYKMSSHLTEHMKTHTGEKNYICEICSKPFYNKKSLEVHKRTHSGQKEFSCPDCDKSFVHHTSLCAHQRKFHRHQEGNRAGAV